MSMNVCQSNMITTLAEQYKDKHFDDILSQSNIELGNCFIGSEKTLNITCYGSLKCSPLCCLAALNINLFALNKIVFKKQTTEKNPVRIYAPNMLQIHAKHVIFEDVMFLAEIEHLFITCEKLTLKFTHVLPNYFETLQKRLTLTNTKIKVIDMADL